MCSMLGAGFFVLNSFEPIEKTIYYLYFFCMSFVFVSPVLMDYLMNRHKKGPFFSFVVYLIAQLPSLVACAVLYYNGAADTNLQQKISLSMVVPEAKRNWGGYSYEVTVKSTDPDARFFQTPGHFDVNRKIAKGLEEGHLMEIVLKPGALGIPWIEKVILNDATSVQEAKSS